MSRHPAEVPMVLFLVLLAILFSCSESSSLPAPSSTHSIMTDADVPGATDGGSVSDGLRAQTNRIADAPASDEHAPHAVPEVTGPSLPAHRALIGMTREAIEATRSPTGVESMWTHYGDDLSIGYNVGVAVRVRIDFDSSYEDCAEAGRALELTNTKAPRTNERGTSICSFSRAENTPLIGHYRNSRMTLRPLAGPGRCGNRILR